MDFFTKYQLHIWLFYFIYHTYFAWKCMRQELWRVLSCKAEFLGNLPLINKFVILCIKMLQITKSRKENQHIFQEILKARIIFKAEFWKNLPFLPKVAKLCFKTYRVFVGSNLSLITVFRSASSQKFSLENHSCLKDFLNYVRGHP